MNQTDILTRLDAFFVALETLATTSLIKKQKVIDTCTDWYGLIEKDKDKVWNDDLISKYDNYITLCEETLNMFDSMTGGYLEYNLRNLNI